MTDDWTEHQGQRFDVSLMREATAPSTGGGYTELNLQEKKKSFHACNLLSKIRAVQWRLQRFIRKKRENMELKEDGGRVREKVVVKFQTRIRSQ